MNGRMNGSAMNGGMPQQVQINPVEASRVGLMFLQQRVQFTASERQMFDMVEAMLMGIANGGLIVTQAPQPTAAPDPPSPLPPEPHE